MVGPWKPGSRAGSTTVHIINWSDDQAARDNAIVLLQFLVDEYRYMVYRHTEKDMDIYPHYSKEEIASTARRWMIAGLHEGKEVIPYAKDDHELIIFCYIGPSRAVEVHHPSGSSSWQRPHLFAESPDRSMEFDLTWMQQYLRDTVTQNVLFIFECDGDLYTGMDDVREGVVYEHKMWTLSAGFRFIRITNGPQDLTRRLVANLDIDRRPASFLQRAGSMWKDVKWEMTEAVSSVECKQDLPNGAV